MDAAEGAPVIEQPPAAPVEVIQQDAKPDAAPFASREAPNLVDAPTGSSFPEGVSEPLAATDTVVSTSANATSVEVPYARSAFRTTLLASRQLTGRHVQAQPMDVEPPASTSFADPQPSVDPPVPTAEPPVADSSAAPVSAPAANGNAAHDDSDSEDDVPLAKRIVTPAKPAKTGKFHNSLPV